MKCTFCTSTDIRPSHRHKWTDTFQGLLGRQAYRCRQCRRRFYGPRTADLAGSMRRHSVRYRIRRQLDVRYRKQLIRKLIAAGVFVLMLVVFWIFLRYIIAYRPPTDDSSWNQAPLVREAQSAQPV